eukprot:SAG22_NODE_113_length_19407_cov_214.925161_2_plen_518_part_00
MRSLAQLSLSMLVSVCPDMLCNVVSALQSAVDASNARREAEAKADLEAAMRVDPREELVHWMAHSVKLGKQAEADAHKTNADLLCKHGIPSLGALRFLIHSEALGIIDLLDRGIETQHQSTAIWTAMQNSIDREKTFAAMYVQRYYRYKVWATAIKDSRLQSQKECTASAAVELGQRHLQKKRWEDALETFEGALKLDPQNNDASDGAEKAKQGLELKLLRKTEGKKSAKAKETAYESEWKVTNEQKDGETEMMRQIHENMEKEDMLRRQSSADALLQRIESGEWDERKKHEELITRKTAEAVEKQKAQDIKDRINQEKAMQAQARRQQIEFEQAEKKRIKQEAADAKRDAREAAKKAKQEEKLARKQNTLEAKKEKAAIDAETKLLKLEEKEEQRKIKQGSKYKGIVTEDSVGDCRIPLISRAPPSLRDRNCVVCRTQPRQYRRSRLTMSHSQNRNPRATPAHRPVLLTQFQQIRSWTRASKRRKSRRRKPRSPILQSSSRWRMQSSRRSRRRYRR